MQFDVMTLFPQMIESYVNESILGRAIKANIINVKTHNIRDFSIDKHRKTDDTPYGGGMGMLMTAQPIVDCYDSFKDSLSSNNKVVYLSPKGKVFNHTKALELSKLDGIVFLCGHYEGVDQRAIDMIVDEEISVGDFVLTGGELACLTIIDAVSRLIDGVLSDQICYKDESVASGLLEYPQYTKPYDFRGQKVPDILISGNHSLIDKWRREKALELTSQLRPELLNSAHLSKNDVLFLEKINSSSKNQE